MDLSLATCPPAPGALGVVPVLIGPLQALLAILWYLIPAIAVALAGALLALFRPRTLVALARLLWRLKLWVMVLAAGVAGFLVATTLLWPSGGAALGAGGAVQGHWPLFRGGLARRGAAEGDIGPSRGGVNWARSAGEEWFFSSPAVAGRRVYVASALVTPFDSKNGTGRVYCFDADTGAVAWVAEPQFDSGYETYRATFASPAVHGEHLVCGEGLHYAAGARVICLDARTGRLRWSARTASHVECTPVIAEVRAGGKTETRVFVGAGDDGYYCLDLATGRQRWHLPGRDYPDAETSLAVHDGKVYAGLGNGGKALCVIDAVDGRELARVPTPYAVFSPPAIADGKLYVGMGNGDFVDAGSPPAGEVWCLDLAKLGAHDGGPIEPDWRIRLGGTVLGAVAVAGERIYFADAAGTVHAADRRTGQVVATFQAHAPVYASPAVTARHVYVITETGMLYGLDRETLEPAWEYKVGSAPRCISSPAVAGGRVYVGTQADGFVCVGAPGEAKAPIWSGRLGGPATGGNPFGSPPPALGDFRWQYPPDQEGESSDAIVAAPPGVMGERLLVPLAGGKGAGKRGLACLPVHGSADKAPPPRWLYETPHGVRRSPAAVGALAFCVDGRAGDANRHLHGVALADGTPRWKATVSPEATGAFLATPSGLLIQDEPGSLSCYDLGGRRRWRRAAHGRMDHAPAIAHAMVIVATAEPAAMSALDRPTGAELWRIALPEPPTAAPWVDRGRILLATKRGLEARSLLDGRPLPPELWKMAGGGVSGDVVADSARVAFVNTRGELVVLTRLDGRLALRPLAGAQVGSTPLLGGGRALYAAADGKVMAVSLSPAGKGDEPPSTGPAGTGVPLPRLEPAEWMDASWLGRPVTPMVLCGGCVYMGRGGWGLVCLGEAR